MNTNMDLLTTEAAKALYCGLVTDTGSFRFDSVNADVHTIVSEILRRGNFNPSEVHEAIFDNRNVNQIQLLGAALNSLKTAADGKIGIIRIHDSDFKHTQTEYSDSDGFSAYALGLKGVIASVVFSELEQGIKLSLRSKRGIDCTKWASFFDGGGHARASGGWFYGTMDEAEKQVIAKGMELLESA